MNEKDKKDILANIKRDIKEGEYNRAFLTLKKYSSPEDDFALQSKHASLLKSIPKESLGLKEIRIGILSSSTADHQSALSVCAKAL